MLLVVLISAGILQVTHRGVDLICGIVQVVQGSGQGINAKLGFLTRLGFLFLFTRGIEGLTPP